jgi:uncharacterized protein involved in oxidation of intracellular sulfur
MKSLLILERRALGTERTYNALRLALALLKIEPAAQITVFLMADAGAAPRDKDAGRLLQHERMLRRMASGHAAAAVRTAWRRAAGGGGATEARGAARWTNCAQTLAPTALVF